MDVNPLSVTDAQLEVAAATFDLLSVAPRLSLVVLLASGESDVSTLAGRSGQAIPATSQQLAKLRAAGIVAARREGRRQLYRVDDPHILTVIEQMFRHIGPEGTIVPEAPATGNARRARARRPRFTAVGGA
ncbi:ArsR/SmtB family transcription factor [Rathayibacter soli]|uniref:ArsR/SmtB family transcription factor n=1 Tax=Rathayibacter soli TaxID=3144168 RepID=UPI0027E428AC|nr:metalloregulator ArsR/SmtB family transcription factor [Glaciibacter superstes]